jgi:hypothetical protein
VEDDGCGVEVATRVACWRPLIAWLRWSMEARDKNGAGWGHWKYVVGTDGVAGGG